MTTPTTTTTTDDTTSPILYVDVPNTETFPTRVVRIGTANTTRTSSYRYVGPRWFAGYWNTRAGERFKETFEVAAWYRIHETVNEYWAPVFAVPDTTTPSGRLRSWKLYADVETLIVDAYTPSLYAGVPIGVDRGAAHRSIGVESSRRVYVDPDNVDTERFMPVSSGFSSVVDYYLFGARFVDRDEVKVVQSARWLPTFPATLEQAETMPGVVVNEYGRVVAQ